MSAAAAFLALTLAGAPTVEVLQGSSSGASPAQIRVVLDDAEAHLKAAGLVTVRSEKRCTGDPSCLVDAAKSAEAQALLVVSFFAGPSGLTVDLDARSAAGAELDVLTTGVGANGHLPGSSDPFFSSLAKKLTDSDRPAEVKLTPRQEPAAGAPVSPVKPLLISGGGLLVISAGLFVVALVLSNQLGGRLSSTGVITGITRAEAQSQASLANGLATASLLSGLAGCALAVVGGLWGLFGSAPPGSSELVEER